MVIERCSFTITKVWEHFLIHGIRIHALKNAKTPYENIGIIESYDEQGRTFNVKWRNTARFGNNPTEEITTKIEIVSATELQFNNQVSSGSDTFKKYGNLKKNL